MKFIFYLLRFVPLKLLSKMSGRLSRIYVPLFIRSSIYKAFGRKYGVRFSEIAREINQYENFVDFFTRDLREGSRPIAEGQNFTSPVDGRILQRGDIDDSGRLLQAKSINYKLEELLLEPELVNQFLNGSYATFYLAPGDYHHIHAPLTGTIKKRVYIPGALFPVSLGAVRNIPSLYCTNERVLTLMETERGALMVIMVGATNVGSIGLQYEPDFREEQVFASKKGQVQKREFKESPVSVLKGERLGTFYLGSTVIVITEKRVKWLTSLEENQAVLLGQLIEDIG